MGAYAFVSLYVAVCCSHARLHLDNDEGLGEGGQAGGGGWGTGDGGRWDIAHARWEEGRRGGCMVKSVNDILSLVPGLAGVSPRVVCWCNSACSL